MVGDIGEVAPVAATELLEVQAADDIPVLILVVGVIYDTVSVLGQTLLAHEVRMFDGIAVCILVDETKLRELAVALELLVVTISVGVVEGNVVAPVATWCPSSGEDVMVLVEVIGSLVPTTTITHGVREHGVAALAISAQAGSQDVELAEASLIHILVSADAIIHQGEVGVVVATEYTAPCLTGLLEVADVLVADLEVVGKPSQTAIVGTRTTRCAVDIAIGSCLVVSAIKDEVLAHQTGREAQACIISIVRTV